MSEPAASPELLRATRRMVRRAVLSVIAAVFLGTGVVAAGVASVRLLQRSGAPSSQGLWVLGIGTIGGIVVAIVMAWMLLAPIEAWFRRGGLALVSGFGTVLAMLVAFPVEGLLGLPGLVGLAAVCLAAGAVLTGLARRIGAVGPAA